ncbi:hypothetical protein Tco_1465867 [Tanacetum coccineum]
MDESIKKLQENTKINTRNQSPSLKNLETQIEQLTKELQSRTTNGAPSSYIRQCKVVNADHEMPNIPNSSRIKENLDYLEAKTTKPRNPLRGLDA